MTCLLPSYETAMYWEKHASGYSDIKGECSDKVQTI